MKSEPDVWSIDQQKKAGSKGAPWDGVRNYQAAKNLKGMKKGDLCFFYHSTKGSRYKRCSLGWSKKLSSCEKFKNNEKR